MSEIPSAGEFLNNIRNDKEYKAFKLATISSLFSNGAAKVTFDGESTESEKQYPYISGYIPNIGDRVLLASVSGTYIIIGKIRYNVSPT